MKPILFNTDMVWALLDGKKTATRRIVKGYIPTDAEFGYTVFTPPGCISCSGTFENKYGEKFFKIPYRKGDILYVRETWKHATLDPAGGGYALNNTYLYKADEPINIKGMLIEEHWHPSIHMPKEAARIFLKVTDVRVERLRDISLYDVWNEGTPQMPGNNDIDGAVGHEDFAYYWDSVIKPKDRNQYGWDANPWVWVIEFEQINRGKET